MSEDPGKCPHCGGESNGTIYYSCPAKTGCRDCGQLWSFGKGIEVLSEEEGRRRRPGMYPPKPAEAPESPGEGLGEPGAENGSGEPR
jgi:hypothetical protein